METCGIDGELYLDKGKGCCIGPIHGLQLISGISGWC